MIRVNSAMVSMNVPIHWPMTNGTVFTIEIVPRLSGLNVSTIVAIFRFSVLHIRTTFNSIILSKSDIIIITADLDKIIDLTQKSDYT